MSRIGKTAIDLIRKRLEGKKHVLCLLTLFGMDGKTKNMGICAHGTMHFLPLDAYITQKQNSPVY